MNKRRGSKKRGGSKNSIPPLQTYGYEAGASSPHQSAMIRNQQAASEQNELNNQHGGRKRRKRGGYQYKGANGRIVVPQSSNGPPSAGPTDGNSLAVGGAEHLSQNKENATVDDYNASPKVTMVHGGAKRKKSRTKKHKRRVSIKSRRSKSKKKYRYFQRGCSKKRNGKKKSRRTSKNKSKRKFISGGRRRRSRVKGGYLNQIWGCFS